MTRAKRLDDAINKIQDGINELEELKSEYEEWQGNLPDNLQNSLFAEKLDETICTLDDFISNTDTSDLKGMDLPQGFGRD